MHAFAAAVGLDADAGERLLAAVRSLGEEFRLDPTTFWDARSRTGKTICGGMHHATHAIGHRRYVDRQNDRAVLFDGLPIDSSLRFAAYDAAQLDEHWPALPSTLEGQFCVVRVDLDADRMEVLTDPFGIVPVFYGRRGSAAVLSTSAGVVASLLRLEALDPLAISSFVALGWAVDRRTLYAGVSALRGGSRHCIGEMGLRSTVHFGPSTVAEAAGAGRSFPSLPRRLADLSGAAVRAGGPVCCALTSGRDTRVMTAMLRSLAVPASYYTFDDADLIDTAVARELAERFELSHHFIPAPDPALFPSSAVTRFIRQNDGLASLVQLIDYIDLEEPARELQITFWGVGGEIGRAGTGVLSNVAPNLPVLSAVASVQQRLLKLKIDDAGLLTGAARASVTGFLDRFADDRRREGWPTRELSEAYYAFERVSSWGATGPHRAAGASDLFSPFCTRPFVEYCFSISPAERYLEAPHHRLLKAFDAELLEPRFYRAFRPQRPPLAPYMAARELARFALSRRRHGVARDASVPAPRPFVDRWLDFNVGALQAMAEAAPQSLWRLIDRRRLIALLAVPAPERSASRDALLRIATLLWWTTHAR